MTIPSRTACWIPKVTNTHSEYIILISYALQQWLREGATMLSHTYATSLLLKPAPKSITTLGLCITQE